jgi:hypothetical protein
MARKAKAKSGVMYPSPYNETNDTGPENPDMNGDGIYFGGFPEEIGMHLKEESMVSTPNTESGDDILGTPTPGEPEAMKGK